MTIKTQYINSSTPVQLVILCSFTAALAKIASLDWCKNSSSAHLRSLCILRLKYSVHVGFIFFIWSDLGRRQEIARGSKEKAGIWVRFLIPVINLVMSKKIFKDRTFWLFVLKLS